jgi:hypothetical protein
MCPHIIKSDWLVILTYMSLLHESVVLPDKKVLPQLLFCATMRLFQEFFAQRVGSSHSLRLCMEG